MGILWAGLDRGHLMGSPWVSHEQFIGNAKAVKGVYSGVHGCQTWPCWSYSGIHPPGGHPELVPYLLKHTAVSRTYTITSTKCNMLSLPYYKSPTALAKSWVEVPVLTFSCERQVCGVVRLCISLARAYCCQPRLSFWPPAFYGGP